MLYVEKTRTRYKNYALLVTREKDDVISKLPLSRLISLPIYCVSVVLSTHISELRASATSKILTYSISLVNSHCKSVLNPLISLKKVLTTRSQCYFRSSVVNMWTVCHFNPEYLLLLQTIIRIQKPLQRY